MFFLARASSALVSICLFAGCPVFASCPYYYYPEKSRVLKHRFVTNFNASAPYECKVLGQGINGIPNSMDWEVKAGIPSALHDPKYRDLFLCKGVYMSYSGNGKIEAIFDKGLNAFQAVTEMSYLEKSGPMVEKGSCTYVLSYPSKTSILGAETFSSRFEIIETKYYSMPNF